MRLNKRACLNRCALFHFWSEYGNCNQPEYA
ncbi:hypothetical protein fHeYen902_101c [Yersinia phage fHe-Yen9-02]|nr:hypothetical protein fHeYen902_101c [Yersinia phage fHe-Yen9-02]